MFDNPSYLWLRQQIPAYVFRYARSMPDGQRFENFGDFRKDYRFDLDAALPALKRMVAKDYDQPLQPLTPVLREELERFFRARLARQLYGPAAYFEVYNEGDEVVQAALDLLRKDNPLAAARSGQRSVN